MDETNTAPIHGIGLAIIVTSILFGVISAVVVCLRVYVRWFEKSIWWDDRLMFGGLILYIVNVILACKDVFLGLGDRNENITYSHQVEATKYLVIWTMVSSASLVSVKSSISMTLLRLASTMPHIRCAIYALLALSISSFLLTVISSLTMCHPIEANWDVNLKYDGKAKCSSSAVIAGISYTSTSITIATDIACAILPGIILWKTQLRPRTKVMVTLLLSFGSFASVCTMIRASYTNYYSDPEILYWIAHIVLWGNIEVGVGLTAGSIPVMQKLIMRRVRKQNSCPSPGPLGLVTFGSAPVKDRINRRVFTNPTDVGFTITTVHATHPHDWERLEDESNSRGCIRADYTYEVELSHSSMPELAYSRNKG
ncbi:hypothetical protein M434DRAFT_38854 [Hypoxylon sp. CO27-5]|nr:hypothetical protein M434DRAFT_38854 [Hypoxylon sp. CO27-5]